MKGVALVRAEIEERNRKGTRISILHTYIQRLSNGEKTERLKKDKLPTK